jgi:hypothetical protein
LVNHYEIFFSNGNFFVIVQSHFRSLPPLHPVEMRLPRAQSCLRFPAGA